MLAHQTGRGGGAHGAGNASLEEGEEVLEDEDEEDEEALEEEDGEEELLADGQYSETESAFEVRDLSPPKPPSVCRVVLTCVVSCAALSRRRNRWAAST